MTPQEARLFHKELVQHLVTESTDFDDLDPFKVAMGLVPNLAKADAKDETVFSKLTENDRK